MTAAPNARRAAMSFALALAAACACDGKEPDTERAFAAAAEPCDPAEPVQTGCSPAFDQCAFDFRICDVDATSPTGWSWQPGECRTQIDEDGPGLCPERDGFVARCEAPNAVEVCSTTSCVYWTDTDGDQVSDEVEVTTGTGPDDADSDDDGCLDGYEIDHGTDPLDPDSDDDELEDCQEDVLETDPLRPDTDGDGLDDALEVAAGTDPLRADTDSDLLLDGDEVAAGTDPHDDDTDDDGYTDGIEVQAGTDPLDPASHPAELEPLPDGGLPVPDDAGVPFPGDAGAPFPLDAGVPDPTPIPRDAGVIPTAAPDRVQ